MFWLTLRLLKRFWQPRLLPKNQRFLLTRLLSWDPLRLNQLKVIEDNCIMICTLFIKLFIFFDIASLNKILRQNAYIIKKIDAALSNKKKGQVQLNQAFIEVMLYYVCYLIVITGRSEEHTSELQS